MAGKKIATSVTDCIIRIDYRERDLLRNFEQDDSSKKSDDGEFPLGSELPWKLSRENLMLGDIVL
jgi:hypothetical protein